jgi:hypothetical protein
MTFTTARARRRLGGVVLAASVLAFTACSDTTSSATQSSTVAVATTFATVVQSTVAASTVPATTVAATAPPVTVDPASALQQGLAALAAGYHFSSIVTVDGVQSLQADGDRVGDASRLVLTGNGGTVEYIIVPAGSYAHPEGGEWSQLDVDPATSDPIVALATPVAVALLPTTDGSVAVRATVAAVALGVAADGNVDVDIVLVNGAITQVSYSTAVEGGTAQVVTTVGPVLDPTPIVAPI